MRLFYFFTVLGVTFFFLFFLFKRLYKISNCYSLRLLLKINERLHYFISGGNYL